jgi:hypothetical protein
LTDLAFIGVFVLDATTLEVAFFDTWASFAILDEFFLADLAVICAISAVNVD